APPGGAQPADVRVSVLTQARSASEGGVSLARASGLCRGAGLLLVALVSLAASLFFYRLGDRDLWSSHEARAAMDAQSLLGPGGGWLPRLHDGRPDFQKPPLYYWLVAGLARLRGGGVDELAVRLPAALSAAGVLLVVGLGLGVGLGRPTAGLLAALVLATGIHFPWLARIGRIDMPLALAVTPAGVAVLVHLARARAT